MKRLVPLAIALCACAPHEVEPEAVRESVLAYDSVYGAVDYTGRPTGLNYGGGKVLTGTVTLYFLTYGGGVDPGIRSLLTAFANELSGSPLASVMTTYDDGNGHHIPQSYAVHPTWAFMTDTSVHGTLLSPTDISGIIEDAINSKKLPRDANGIYVVIPGPSVQSKNPFGSGNSCDGFPCAFHLVDSLGPSNLQYAFINHPDACLAYGTTACQGASPSPNNNPQGDYFASGLWHELTEALTDPGANDSGYWINYAVYDDENEVADGCWSRDSISRPVVGPVQYDLDYTLANGAKANTWFGTSHHWNLQSIWQNADRGGCVRRVVLNRPAAHTAAQGLTTATGDLDGDGYADLLWRDVSNGDVSAMLLDSSDHALSTGPITGGSHGMAWQVVGHGDMNGDTSADLLWRNLQTGEIQVWGLGGLTVTEKATLTTPAKKQAVKAIGDFDGNGKDDLLFLNLDNNVTHVWYNWSWAPFDVTSLTPLSPALSSGDNLETVGSGDFDGDHKADVLWRDLANADTFRLWKFNGNSVTSTTFTLAVNRVLGIVDVDRDGKAELVAISDNGNDVVWYSLATGTPGSKHVIGTKPLPEWRFSGGSRFGSGQTGILWMNRATGDLARWILDSTGTSTGSNHIVVGQSPKLQLIGN